ncbi:hypothetical protein [Streptomyces sp. NPDC102283]|uniref:hypothetical protein n=1 Tax=Streptomyces sp. NPDC102283 TaxID=3366155 RepID=UPI0037F8BE8B
MPRKTRSPAQKLARKLQADTGKPYTACLAEAERQLAQNGKPDFVDQHANPDIIETTPGP